MSLSFVSPPPFFVFFSSFTKHSVIYARTGDRPYILSSQPYVLGIQSQSLDDDEAPLCVFFHSWHSEVQNDFPCEILTGS
jgi:hypothetical protein